MLFIAFMLRCTDFTFFVAAVFETGVIRRVELTEVCLSGADLL